MREGERSGEEDEDEEEREEEDKMAIPNHVETVRPTQVRLKPTTYCLLGRCSTTEPPRQLSWLGRIKAIQGKEGNQSNLT